MLRPHSHPCPSSLLTCRATFRGGGDGAILARTVVPHFFAASGPADQGRPPQAFGS